jgi:hypothetical protein
VYPRGCAYRRLKTTAVEDIPWNNLYETSWRIPEPEVNLRPTVSRPVYLSVRHPSGTRDQFFFLLEISFRHLHVYYFVAHSLTRGRVCNLLYNCFWSLPDHSLLGRSSTELTASRYFSIKSLLSCTHESEWTPFQTHYVFHGSAGNRTRATEELLERKSSGSGLENLVEYGRRYPSRWPRNTLYPQKLALISPISFGRSVGRVCSRTEATEFGFFFCVCLRIYEIVFFIQPHDSFGLS